ncbi:tetratricopeptide repeat protein, partial [candidate division KSB1 bacterium]|nr:tetratricopeptide repeat protein [candidate division KSB1 bacterium]
MPAKKVLYQLFIVCVVLVGIAVISSAFMIGCATTGPQETGVSLERQKAIQDSLRKIWDRQLNIQWSTGFENHKNKMYRDAVKPFWRVAELDTVQRFPDLYTFLGSCYVNLNMPDSAEMVYRLGTERYPDKAHYWRSLGYYLVAKNENEEAIECYRQAIELDGTKVSDYQQLGNLLIKEDDPDGALP